MSDKAFLTDGRPYLTTRQAAELVGYTPNEALQLREDRQIRNFYEWCRRRGVQQCPGREVWRRRDLVAAIEREDQPTSEDTVRIEALVEEHMARSARVGRH